MKTVNLYGEDGIEIYVDNYGDIVDTAEEADFRVIGHALYTCSIEEARRSILRAHKQALHENH